MSITDNPFGRQAEPVLVALSGCQVDVEYWQRELGRRAEFKGDMVQQLGLGIFKIYPRAVND